MKAVIVGAGNISGAWFPNLAAEGVEVVGIVDLNRDAAKAKAKQWNLDPFITTNLKSAIKKTRPDFVVDLTIPDAHCKVTCTALGMGCHVIGEKPMAASMSQAKKMVKAAEAARKIYMVSQSRRYDPRHEAIASSLKVGKLGHLTTVNCAFYLGAHFGGFRDVMDSPLILDMSIHHFDLVRMLCGLDPVSVYAQEFNPQGSWYKGKVAASCIFEMSNGVVFTYVGSWCSEGMHTSWHGDWRMIGDKGTIVYEKDQQPVGEFVTGTEGFFRPKESFSLEDVSVAGGQQGALKEFLTAINGGALPQGECHDNIKSLAMVFAAVESSRKGKKIKITW